MREAQDYTWHALEKAYRPGMGQYLPDRLFWAREDDGARGDDAADTLQRPMPRMRAAPMREARTERRARQRARRASRGLYAVTPDVDDTAAAGRARSTRRSTAAQRVVQYRNKTADARAAPRAGAARSRACTRRADALFIVNDDAGIAAEVDADGVHLGEDDGDIAAAREQSSAPIA